MLGLQLNHVQGRIQDLKLGVAQVDWKILKTGGAGVGGGIYNFYSIYIIRYISYMLFSTIFYILSPITNTIL